MPRHPGFDEALRCIADRRWFDAHEGLEDAWRAAAGRERRTLQGMIHIVVAFEHVRRGNPRGARAQWTKAQAKLEGAPETFHGIRLAVWQQAVEAWFGEYPTAGASDPEAASGAAPRPTPI